MKLKPRIQSQLKVVFIFDGFPDSRRAPPKHFQTQYNYHFN